MITPPSGVRVLVATRAVDFRRGAENLASIVQTVLGHDPFSGTIYVFRVIAFAELLTHAAGPAAGQPFCLRDWQKRIIRGIYGPETADGRRAVRQALITMPRKNGKTELCAALALYHLLADGEINGQVYSAAADRHQAALVYNAAVAMIRADPELCAFVNIVESLKRIVHYRSGSEPYRVCRRLQLLRDWSHDEIDEVLS